MSNYIVKIIPKHEKTIPGDKERNTIRNQLRIMAVNKEISEQLYNEIIFIDSGSNFEGIRYNHCMTYLEPDWWAEQMDTKSSTHFNDLSIISPCCASAVSLNELHYIWPMGFAKYVIEIMNPEEAEVIRIEQFIENINYKLIRAHY